MKKRQNRKRFKKRISEIIKIAVMTMDTVNTILGGWDKWRGLF